VVIFPEGRITVTGGLMKVYDGPGMIAERAGAAVVPVRIDGAQYSLFSYLRGKLRRRPFPRITLTILAPRRIEVAAALRGRARRRAAGERMHDVMAEMMAATADVERTLPQALADSIRSYGGGHPALEDSSRRVVGLRRLAVMALALGRGLAHGTRGGDAVGLLLPNATATAAAVLGLQMVGRVPALLNYTAGVAGLEAACGVARLRRVVTSRRFVEAARLADTVARLAETVELIHLEDLAGSIGPLRRLAALAGLPGLRRRGGDPDAAAVILFTSGSEGAPKGVVLSHRNLLANAGQMAAVVEANSADSVFAALPLFHAFGLLGGLVLPLLLGIKSFLYPNPRHYRRVPELVYDSGATILFGTDTFLTGYGRVAHPLDFRSVRMVFAGAEKVREDTRRLWAERFGLRLLEGYGATETAPVLAVNTPSHYRPGSVGRFLPGIEHRLDRVEGVELGGRLWVRGPNVMLGYLKADRPGEIEALADGWYDTGDIVAVDADGYVTVLGRAKRFAKVAGEMISLAAVEEAAASLWPEHRHAVLAQPDERRGERLVLVTTRPGADRAGVAAALEACGVAPLAVPRVVVVRDHLPLLGSGKVDYPALERMIP
jgi:acyl-[acyl-carrier-protein]-phospholipid O-acyltransferase/long-chain-fatty-acid--[acyl-carrier-protein] ligase